MIRHRVLLGLGMAVILVLAALGRSPAARAVPTTRFVATTGTNSGNCTNTSGNPICKTITYAISQSSPGDTIAVAAGTYNTALGETLPLDISTSLTISGAGAGSTLIDGGGSKQEVSISSGVTATLQSLTVENGRAATGGGIINSGGAALTLTNVALSNNFAAAGNGGGIENGGSATVTNVTLSNNTASATEGGGIDNGSTAMLANVTLSNNTAADGGGIFNNGGSTLTLTDATLNGNSASATFGGGVENRGTATLTNVTFSGNSALHGGGLSNDAFFGSTATATLSNVTLSGNSASSSGGGIFNYVASGTATLTLQASIVANSPSGGDCAKLSGTLTSKGGNVGDDASCSLTQPSDAASTNPLLAPLALNPGPNNNTDVPQTTALQPGSPAIDRVPSSLCPPPATDERGVVRPQGPACDSGAYEMIQTPPSTFIVQPLPLGVPTATPTRAPAPSATPSPTPTATPGCATVTYAAGWNLAGGPDSTLLAGASGSLFTFQARDTNYESLSVFAGLSAGTGYWVFFFSPTTVTLPCVTSTTLLVTLPANHFIMVGDPFDRPATVSGAQMVDTFNPATNSYTSATGTVTLQPGQGAWVFSSTGGTLTIT